jgi:hypothetical protein
VAWFGDQPVSLNILDYAKNDFSKTKFEQRCYKHASNSMWQKLVERYDINSVSEVFVGNSNLSTFAPSLVRDTAMAEDIDV